MAPSSITMILSAALVFAVMTLAVDGRCVRDERFATLEGEDDFALSRARRWAGPGAQLENVHCRRRRSSDTVKVLDEGDKEPETIGQKTAKPKVAEVPKAAVVASVAKVPVAALAEAELEVKHKERTTEKALKHKEEETEKAVKHKEEETEKAVKHKEEKTAKAAEAKPEFKLQAEKSGPEPEPESTDPDMAVTFVSGAPVVPVDVDDEAALTVLDPLYSEYQDQLRANPLVKPHSIIEKMAIWDGESGEEAFGCDGDVVATMDYADLSAAQTATADKALEAKAAEDKDKTAEDKTAESKDETDEDKDTSDSDEAPGKTPEMPAKKGSEDKRKPTEAAAKPLKEKEATKKADKASASA